MPILLKGIFIVEQDADPAEGQNPVEENMHWGAVLVTVLAGSASCSTR
jgi:hypothetical protein